MEESGFGRIQVLRLALLDDASAESDYPAAYVADREHDAIPEAIVIMLARGSARLPVPNLSALALDDQTQLRQCPAVALRAAEALEHFIPGVRRVTDAEVLDRGPLESPTLQVLPGARIASECFRVESGDSSHQLI